MTLQGFGSKDAVLSEPALEALLTHPRLLPVLMELMEGQVRSDLCCGQRSCG
eukprot:SAG31_NODE_14074_length_828_cov_1.654321_2_plen_51_part_01